MDDIKVHPFAELWDMLADDELAVMATSIRDNGLRHPLVVDKDGVLIDGRNRLVACKLAGVEPTFVTWTPSREGDTVERFIADANTQRRTTTKGAKAMAIALTTPAPKMGRPGGLDGPPKVATELGLSGELVRRARAVIEEVGPTSDIVKAIINGGSLNDAYDHVQGLRRARTDHEWLARETQRAEADLAQLRATLDKIGTEPLPAVSPSDLEVTKMSAESFPPLLGLPSTEQLQSQQVLLGTLTSLGERMDDLAAQPVIEGGLYEMFVSGVTSGCARVIKASIKLADAYKATLNRPKIRRVH